MPVATLAELVAAHVRDGDSVALEGFTHLVPFAAAQELIRQRLTDLHLIRMTPDLVYDQLIGVGAARALTFSWGGNPGVGSAHRLREAVESGWPRPLVLNEHTHAGMGVAYTAGAAHLPFGVLRGYIGTDLTTVNPAIRSVTCPYTGEVLATVPALNPDVTILHAQKEAALAATKLLVTVEDIGDALAAPMNAIVLPAWVVTGIACVPGGAWPSYARGYYPRDNAFYIAWDAISRDRARFTAWIDRHVRGTLDHAGFLRALAQADAA